METLTTTTENAEVVSSPAKVENEPKKEKEVEQFGMSGLSLEVRQQIDEKAKQIKEKLKLRKIYVVVVPGEDDDDKPFYVAYLRRPNLMQFSQYMSFFQKDVVQANKMLAQSVFIEGDRELVDDDELFLYGLMNHLSQVVESRNGELVKR